MSDAQIEQNKVAEEKDKEDVENDQEEDMTEDKFA